MKVFFDTNLFIYLWEQSGGARADAVRRVLKALRGAEGILVTSALTLAEILVHPMKRREDRVVKAYVERFGHLELVAFDTACAVLFAGIRARSPRVRPPDAIQLACAARARCDWFLTNDRRLSGVQVPGISRCGSYEEFPFG